MEIVRAEGVREVASEVEFYNLDAVIAVGYRLNSYQSIQFLIQPATAEAAVPHRTAASLFPEK